MSAGYPAAAAQALDVASLTRKHRLGEQKGFIDANGDVVYARYVRNTSGGTLSAGMGSFVEGDEDWGVGLTHVAYTKHFAGVAPTDVTDDYYFWAVFEGSIETALPGGSYASSSGIRYLTVATNGRLATAASTVAGIVGVLRATTSALTSTNEAGGQIVDLLPR